MSEKPKGLMEGGPKSALDEGLARFDRLIESVKLNQAPPQQPAATNSNPLMAEGPEEAWARQFRSAAIGPELRPLAPSELAPVPRAAVVPDLGFAKADFAPPASRIAPAPQVLAADMPTGMRAHIGKPVKKTSWLGRLMGRREA